MLAGTIIGLVVGGAVGAAWREIYLLKEHLKKPIEVPKTTGVVTPAYRPPQETKQTRMVIRPKSPQQMEWMAKERMQKEALGGLH